MSEGREQRPVWGERRRRRKPMFAIHYVASRDSDAPIQKQTTASLSLDKAISLARTRIRTTNLAVHSEPGVPRPVGFLIFDASGTRLLHREYPLQPGSR